MDASPGDTEITLSWDPTTIDDLAGYRVYYGTSSRGYGNPVAVACPGIKLLPWWVVIAR